jgi:hypothetical protein
MVPFVNIALKMHASQQGPTLVVFVLGPASFVPASVTGIEMRVRNDAASVTGIKMRVRNDVRCSVATARECRQVRYVGAAAWSCAGHQLARAFLLDNRNNNEAFYQRGHIGKVTPLDLSLAQWHTADSPAGSTAGVQGWASLSTSDVLKNPSMG